MDEPLTPPSPERVKARLMLLCANWLRSGWEMGDGEGLPDPEEIRAWVERLAPEATPEDIANHALPVGDWSQQQVINGTWAGQSGGALEWGLGLKDELEPWDESSWWTDEVQDGFQDFPDPQTWRPDLVLRGAEEIEREAMVIETCLWRLRPGREIRPHAVEYVKKLLARAADLGHVTLAPDGDLLCSDGRSLADRSDDEANRIQSLLTEKLQALNWLCGQEENYTDVTANTIVGWLWDQEP